jgi:hypothetical protein
MLKFVRVDPDGARCRPDSLGWRGRGALKPQRRRLAVGLVFSSEAVGLNTP